MAFKRRQHSESIHEVSDKFVLCFERPWIEGSLYFPAGFLFWSICQLESSARDNVLCSSSPLFGHLLLSLELCFEVIPLQACRYYDVRWLGGVVVGRRTCDREVASSIPGQCIAG